MSTLKKVKLVALKHRAIIIDEKIGASHTCTIEAPKGFVWVGSGLHELVDSSYIPWKPDYEDLYARMLPGITECPEGISCEWCIDCEA